jgi:hypothetical protein
VALTEEERRIMRMQAQMQRAAQGQSLTPLEGQMSPNMINQSALLPERVQATESDRANALQDFTGKEAALAAQMRGGRQQMDQAMPQGRTVGNQYLAPNWAENLAGAVSKGMGAYDVAQARGGQRGLEKSRKEKADALGKVAGEDRYNKAMAVDTENQRNRSTDDRAERKLVADALREEARIKEANASIGRSAAALKAKNARDDKYRKDQAAAKVTAAKILAKNKLEAAGVSASKGQFDKPKTAKERELFKKGGETAAVTQGLLNDFKPGYAAPAGLRALGMGGLESTIGRRLPILTGKETEDQAQWWSRVGKAELEPRHEKFGSAFTEPEQKLYEATTINENDSDTFIKAQLEDRVAFETRAAERNAYGALLNNYNPALVEEYYGDAVDVPQLIADMESGAYVERRRGEEDAAEESWKKKQAGESAPEPNALPNNQVLDDEEEEIYRKFPNLRPR